MVKVMVVMEVKSASQVCYACSMLLGVVILHQTMTIGIDAL